MLNRARLSLQDFLYISGRRRDQVEGFLTQSSGDKPSPYTPTMGDVMLVELAARGEDNIEIMFDIADRYSEGPLLTRRN